MMRLRQQMKNWVNTSHEKLDEKESENMNKYLDIMLMLLLIQFLHGMAWYSNKRNVTNALIP